MYGRPRLNKWIIIIITSLTSCDCSFYKEHQVPCLHIMFVRNNDGVVPTFDISIFDTRYYRNTDEE